jgi:type I restriction enzyme S subunit
MHEFKRRFPHPPDDWTQHKISEIADRVNQRNTEANQNVLTISAEHGLISQTEYFSRRVASESVTGYFLLESGDFAYNKSYSKGYPLGAIRRLERYAKGCVSPLYICFRPKASVVDSGFLMHYLDGGAIDAGLADVAKEGVRNHGLLNVGVADFFGLDIPLPPIAEQRKVAQVLDTLDTTIRQTEAIIAKLKQVKQGLLHDLLTRGINANGELRPPQSEAPHLYKASPLGWIPVEWHASPLESFLERIIDYRGKTPEKTETGVPLITARNVRLGFLDPEPREFIQASAFEAWMTRGIPKRGDILFTMEAPLGNVAQIETDERLAFAQRLIIMQAASGVSSTFLKYLLLGEGFRNRLFALGSGSTVEGIQQSTLRRLPIAMPTSCDEQEMIAQRLSEFDRSIDSEAAHMEKSQSLKSGLMDDLLTGRVRVTPLLAQAPATQP